MGVPGPLLDVVERQVLGKQVRDHEDPERVGLEDRRQPVGLESALKHLLPGET